MTFRNFVGFVQAHGVRNIFLGGYKLRSEGVIDFGNKTPLHLTVPASEAFKIATDKRTHTYEIMVLWRVLIPLMSERGLPQVMLDVDRAVTANLMRPVSTIEERLEHGWPTTPAAEKELRERVVHRLVELEQEGKL